MRFRILFFCFALTCLVASMPLLANSQTVQELRSELRERRSELERTRQNIEEFRQGLQEKKQEARTLEDQIDLIEANVREIELSIEQTRAEVAKTNAEIDAVEKEIELTEEEIERQKVLLAEYIRSIHMIEQQSMIVIFFRYATFSEVIQESATLKELQKRGYETLMTIRGLHDDLKTQRRELEDFKQSLIALQNRQEQQQSTLATQQESKQRILELTLEKEAEYQGLLASAEQTHRQAEAAISDIDNRIREELRRQGQGSLPSVGTMSWPIEPIFGISCGFHCPGYPYQHVIGPHTGIDVPTYMGTPIKAPADGYVARAFDSGGPGYSYIMLVHGDNVSTVYGHISGFAVNEGQMITRGTVIGYTGGAPGTRGAGLSTGPHLHFEVRLNNRPVNPMNYLSR